jgi:broad specificity phosphatase PhoE
VPGYKNFIIVSHGVTIRAFIMQWLHLTPNGTSTQHNPANGSITMISSDGRALMHSHTSVRRGFPRTWPTKQTSSREG